MFDFLKKTDEKNTKLQKTESKNFFTIALEKTIANISHIRSSKADKIEFDIIEKILIESDVSYDIVTLAMNGLPKLITREQLRHRLISLFEFAPTNNKKPNSTIPYVQLVIGVNGAGKTTTIAKLANIYKLNGKSVIFGAGDTFRAAAIEQLTMWASKLNIPIVKTKQGHDPSAIAFDTIQSAIAKNIDICIIDTAGRLQTQSNLTKELEKIVKVCNKAQNDAPHQILLILDGTQGNSAISQAKAFSKIVRVDGIIITKLDGTSKGGALFSISNELELPILYVGIGEKIDDLIPFKENEFVDSLLNSIYN